MKRIAIGSVLPCLVIALLAAACGSPKVAPKPTPTAAPAGQTVAGGVHIVAEGRVAPSKSVALSFAMGGTLSEVPVAAGQQVAAGTVLAQLDPAQYALQLAQAEANLAAAQVKLDQLAHGPAAQDVAAAQQDLASAQATYERLRAGPSAGETAAAQAALAAAQQDYARVRSGASADQMGQLSAQLDNARAALEQAQAAYDRVKGSPDIGMLPQSLQLQQATNNYNAAQAAYNEARSHPTQAELAAAASQVQQAQAALDRLTPDPAQVQQALAGVEGAKAQLARLQPSADERAALQAGLDAARAARDLAEEQLKRTRLVAPFAGTVMTLDVAPGEYAAPGVVAVRLADTSAWQIETTDLTELNIAQVAKGMPATITLDAIPGLELPGHVRAIRPYGETRQGDIVFTVIVSPDQQDARLRWNMTAKVTLESE